MDIISSFFCCADEQVQESGQRKTMNTERTETKPSNRRDLPRNNGDSRQVRSAELYKEENTDTTVSSGSTPKLRDSDSNKKKGDRSRENAHTDRKHANNKSHINDADAAENSQKRHSTRRSQVNGKTHDKKRLADSDNKKGDDNVDEITEEEVPVPVNKNSSKKSTSNNSNNVKPSGSDLEKSNSNMDGEKYKKLSTEEEEELANQLEYGTKLSQVNSVGSDNSEENYDSVPTYDEEDLDEVEEEEEYIDLTVLQPGQYHAPGLDTLLSPKGDAFKHKKGLVLDLDETLVHSSFKYLHTADFVLPVDIDDQIHNVYVIKRPGVDEFLQRVGELYEVVVFTASVSRYGDPLLDVLDKSNNIHHRLFRDACYTYEGNYIKNLSQIGRPLSEIIILDNSPPSYIFHPQHAIPISSWFSDSHDNELLDILPLLEDLAKPSLPDIGKVLDVTI